MEPACGGDRLSALDLARRVVDLAADKKAEDIVLLDIRDHTSFTDYFVILSALSERQLRALEDDLQETLRKEGARPLHVEGTPESGWVLMDYGDVIVHLFSPEEREYYRLERLWSDAQPVLRVQ